MNLKQTITIFILIVIVLVTVLLGCSDKPIISDKSSYSLLGSEPIDPNVVKNYPQSLPIYPTIPSAIDNSNMIPVIGYQGNLGSCTGWAYGYCMRSAMAKRKWNVDIADTRNICSPAFLYKMGIAEAKKQIGQGLNPKIVQDTLVKWGSNSLYNTPYSDTDTNYNMNLIDNNVFRIDSYKTVDSLNRNDIKAELTVGNIVNVSLFLYTDFPDYKGGVYKGNGTWWIEGLNIQSHAMCIVGFDDNKNAYKIANSWSTSWGEEGFVWIDYNTFERMCNIAFVSYDYRNTRPEPAGDKPFDDIRCNIQEAYQYKAANGWHILYFDVEFNQPVYLKEISIISPDNIEMSQTNDMWFRRGIIYYYSDNEAFPGGNYTLKLNNTTFYGIANSMEVKAAINGSHKTCITSKQILRIHGMNRKVVE